MSEEPIPVKPAVTHSLGVIQVPTKYDDAGNITEFKNIYANGAVEEIEADGNPDVIRANWEGNNEFNKWRKENPALYDRLKSKGPGGLLKSKWYNAGKSVYDFATDNEKTWVGKLLDHGVLPGTLLGGASGYLLGEGLRLYAKHFLPKNHLLNGLKSFVPGTVLGVLGGGLGGMLGHVRHTNVKNQENVAQHVQDGIMHKKAAMYQDPRNFILEKLQSATDISSMMKASLADRVRRLSPQQAQTLAAAVRAAVGFGVGALIAKFLGVNTAFGGIVGALAPAVFKTMTSGNPWVAPSYKFY